MTQDLRMWGTDRVSGTDWVVTETALHLIVEECRSKFRVVTWINQRVLLLSCACPVNRPLFIVCAAAQCFFLSLV